MDKRRAAAAGIVLLSVPLCAWLKGDDVSVSAVAGALAAWTVSVIMLRLVKAGDGIFYSVMTFIFLASPLGSVIDLYRLWGPYDKIVHFLSGVLIAYIGYEIAVWIASKCKVKDISAIKPLLALTAFLFAGAAAGIWEIFEFTADKLAGGEMQRGMTDTITDMIAGNGGGLTAALILLKRK